jgi:phage antirepressor YoqD-like protein
MIIMMTTTELAAALDTTPRTLRKFLRSNDSGIESVGKGSRYALPSSKREVNSLAKRFNEWNTPKIDADAPNTDAD